MRLYSLLQMKVFEKRLSDDADQAGYKKIEGSVWVKIIIEIYTLYGYY